MRGLAKDIEFARLDSIILGGYETRVFVHDHISTAGPMRRAFSGDDAGMHANAFCSDGCVASSDLASCTRQWR